MAAFAVGVALLGLSFGVTAEDKKEATKEEKLTGTITCAKCDLGIEKKCATVIKVKDKVYYFDTAAHKKYHGDTCTASQDGAVVGTTKKDGDKMIVTVSKLEYK